MDFDNRVVFGAGGLIFGLLLGFAIGGSGDDLAKASLAETRELADKVEALGERIGGIEGAVTTLNGAQTEGVAGLGARIDGIAEKLAGNVEALGGGISDAVKSQIEGLRGELSSLVARAGGAVGAGAATGSGTGTAAAPGATVVLSEGKLRIFVSAADATGGTARVAVNGQTLVPLEVGKAYDADGCKVELTGFDKDGAAMIDGGC